MNGSTVFVVQVYHYKNIEKPSGAEGLDWVCGPCLVDINGDSGEDDDTHIDQLGGYVVPPLIVEPDVSVNIPHIPIVDPFIRSPLIPPQVSRPL